MKSDVLKVQKHHELKSLVLRSNKQIFKIIFYLQCKCCYINDICILFIKQIKEDTSGGFLFMAILNIYGFPFDAVVAKQARTGLLSQFRCLRCILFFQSQPSSLSKPAGLKERVSPILNNDKGYFNIGPENQATHIFLFNIFICFGQNVQLVRIFSLVLCLELQLNLPISYLYHD